MYYDVYVKQVYNILIIYKMNNTDVNTTSVNKKKSRSYYNFGVSNEIIWGSHLLMGIFFVYVGYELIMNRKLSVPVALIIVVLGEVGALYHAHLWYESLRDKK